MPGLSTSRMIVDAGTSATEGRVAWAPGRSLWIGGMTAAAPVLAPFATMPVAVPLFPAASAVTLCAGPPGWWLLLALRRLGLVWGLQTPDTLQPRDGLRRVQP